MKILFLGKDARLTLVKMQFNFQKYFIALICSVFSFWVEVIDGSIFCKAERQKSPHYWAISGEAAGVR
jgi:hypothetical protein